MAGFSDTSELTNAASWPDGFAKFHACWVEPKIVQCREARHLTQRQCQEISHWLGLLHAEDKNAALAVTQHLTFILTRLETDGMARWILDGMRRYPLDSKKLVAYCNLEDPCAVEALHAEVGAASLEQALPSLTYLMRALCQRGMTLQARVQSVLNAPPWRPVLTGSHLLLPDGYTSLDGSDRYRIYRAAVAHAAAHILHSVPTQPSTGLKPMGIAVVSAIEDARVEQLLVQELPGVRTWFAEFLTPDVDSMRLDFASLIARISRVLHDPQLEDDNFWVNKARDLYTKQVQRSGLQDYAALRSVASILANDLGQMRVRFNVQNYAVPNVYRDDHSFLWDYGDPQTPQTQEQDLHQTGVRLEAALINDSDRNQQAEEVPPAAENESEHSYPEWDYQLGICRPQWCTVRDQAPVWRGSEKDKLTTTRAPQLHLNKSRRLNRSHWLRRQWEGEQIDLNATIDIQVQRRLKLSPDGRLYLRAAHQIRNTSVLVLLDLSESANDHIGKGQYTLLEMEKQAALMLARSTQTSHDRLAIHGFSSNTRAAVHYSRLLNFGDPLNAYAEHAIDAVHARYSTRMGAALRHATSVLSTETSNQRAILLVTDGAPSDIDVFDAKYLTEDARHAVHQAQQQGIRCLGLVLDPTADAYARRIFGWRNYRIVDSADYLAKYLSNLYARLAKL